MRALLFAILVAFCLPVGAQPVQAQGRTAWPPDRTAWAQAPRAARSAHARAVLRALDTSKSTSVDWSDAGVSGRVRMRSAWRINGIVCRSFDDTIRVAGRTRTVRDLACWGSGWRYARGRGRFVAVNSGRY